jgi:hypothetical protein
MQIQMSTIYIIYDNKLKYFYSYRLKYHLWTATDIPPMEADIRSKMYIALQVQYR